MAGRRIRSATNRATESDPVLLVVRTYPLSESWAVPASCDQMRMFFGLVITSFGHCSRPCGSHQNQDRAILSCRLNGALCCGMGAFLPAFGRVIKLKRGCPLCATHTFGWSLRSASHLLRVAVNLRAHSFPKNLPLRSNHSP